MQNTDSPIEIADPNLSTQHEFKMIYKNNTEAHYKQLILLITFSKLYPPRTDLIVTDAIYTNL